MLYPVPAVLVSVADSAGNDNLITIAWTGTVCSDPAMTYISVRKERYSHHMLKENKEFVINLVSKEICRAADFCGVRSGCDLDKFEATGSSGSCSMAALAAEAVASGPRSTSKEARGCDSAAGVP